MVNLLIFVCSFIHSFKQKILTPPSMQSTGDPMLVFQMFSLISKSFSLQRNVENETTTACDVVMGRNGDPWGPKGGPEAQSGGSDEERRPS